MSSSMREDWIECTFGEIAIIYNGDSINAQIKKDKYQKITNGFNYIGTKDIDYDGSINYINGVKIPTNENKFKIAPKGCVLVCSEGGSAGRKTAYVDEDICFGNKLYAITNQYSVFEAKYIYYYTRFRGFFEDFKNQMNGIIGGVSANKFSEIPFPLSPLPIQRAIVSKIEALFSDLDNGIANFKKAQEQLKIYRQAVLKKAFDNGNKSYKIEKVCKAIFAGGDKPKKFFSIEKTDELSVPIYANAIPNNGLLGYTKEASINEKAITIAARGSGTGHVELREKPFLPIVRLITIVPNLDIVHIKYLYYFLKNIDIKGGGSAIPQLTIPMVKQFQIHLPSIEEQTEIVTEIESRLSVCDKMEQSINESIAKAEALRQSILKKAFEGKLLSQAEIDLCKKETDYEPASELLKKIQAEKVKTNGRSSQQK